MYYNVKVLSDTVRLMLFYRGDFQASPLLGSPLIKFQTVKLLYFIKVDYAVLLSLRFSAF